MLNTGSFSVRVRLVTAPNRAATAWFYSHRSDGWHKERNPITHPQLVQAIEATLNMLVSKERTNQWSARRHASSDFHDFDLQFHRHKLECHLGDQLESALAGMLFRDAHDSTKDDRRSIRPRRTGQPQAKRI